MRQGSAPGPGGRRRRQQFPFAPRAISPLLSGLLVDSRVFRPRPHGGACLFCTLFARSSPPGQLLARLSFLPLLSCPLPVPFLSLWTSPRPAFPPGTCLFSPPPSRPLLSTWERALFLVGSLPGRERFRRCSFSGFAVEQLFFFTPCILEGARPELDCESKLGHCPVWGEGNVRIGYVGHPRVGSG